MANELWVQYLGNADRVVPFPRDLPDLVFTQDRKTVENVPADLAEKLRNEPGERWRVQTQEEPQKVSGKGKGQQDHSGSGQDSTEGQ